MKNTELVSTGNELFTEHHTTMESVVGDLLTKSKSTLAVAESCTGGLLGGRITSVPGSSNYFLGGILAYSNAVKINELCVDPAVLAQEGAVSSSVAKQMAYGIREKLGADYGIGITGIAGPTGGTADKPVGLVYIALANSEDVQVASYRFGKGRERVRRAATQMALDLLRRSLIGFSS